MKKLYTGIDIGTYHVKVVIAAPPESSDIPMQILGTGIATSKGMRHGYIIDKAEAARSIKEALARASSAARVQVQSARIALGGIGLEEMRSTGDVPLTTSGGIVTEKEIERALRESEKRMSSKLANRTASQAYRLTAVEQGGLTIRAAAVVNGVVKELTMTLSPAERDAIAENIRQITSL